MSDLISRQEAFDEIIWNSDNGVIDAKVAIEALRKLPSVEPESCEDCISRADAFKALQIKGDYNTLNEVYERLEKLPSVTPAMIPVSERLPEPKKDVVVWTIQGNKPRHFVAALFPHKTYGYVWIGEEEIHLYPEQVLYWMSLPDPYDGEVDG